MGSLPGCAVALFGGIYSALHSMSHYNYDVLTTVCLAPVWHIIPGGKDFFQGCGKMGNWFTNMIVLGCKDKLSVNIRQEWDTVIVSTPDPNPTIDVKKLVFAACNPPNPGVGMCVYGGLCRGEMFIIRLVIHERTNAQCQAHSAQPMIDLT